MMNTVAPTADYSIPGMRIRQLESGGLLVQSTAKQDEWVDELPTITERISRPRVPTTIHYRDQYYRIDSVEQTENGWLYLMSPWPEGSPRLNIYELDAGLIKAQADESRQLRLEVEMAHTAVVWAWMLGWLPSPIQNRLADRMNFSPADASRVEAMVQLMLCLGLTWIHVMNPPYGFFFFFATLEGGIRWIHTMVTQEPHGFWPLEVASRLIAKAIQRLSRPKNLNNA